jgi:hypothetical protein
MLNLVVCKVTARLWKVKPFQGFTSTCKCTAVPYVVQFEKYTFRVWGYKRGDWRIMYTPSSLVDIYHCFGGIYTLHCQDGGNKVYQVLPERKICTRSHDVISQERVGTNLCCHCRKNLVSNFIGRWSQYWKKSRMSAWIMLILQGNIPPNSKSKSCIDFYLVYAQNSYSIRRVLIATYSVIYLKFRHRPCAED